MEELDSRLIASDVFRMVYTVNWVFLILLSYRCLKNMIHQVGSKNEWLLLSVTFTAKLDLVFVLTFENGTRDFQNSSPFERSACFYVTISESFKRFQYFDFETNFLENENLFQKTGVPSFSWNHWDWKHQLKQTNLENLLHI